jgi:guanylate kinase
MRGKIFIIASPSGGGKTTIANGVIDKLHKMLSMKRVITYTSREKRSHEIHGKDYFFVSKEEFLKKKENDFFLETTTYNGELYGSSRNIVRNLKEGISYVIVVDREGVKSYTQFLNKDDIITIWIIPPNLKTLRERLIKRGTESRAQIDARVSLAKKEILWEENNRRFEYHIVNEDIDEAVNQVCLIVKDMVT